MLRINKFNDNGYRITEGLAKTDPGLFIDSDTCELKARIEAIADREGVLPYQTDIELEVGLDPLNLIEQPGPETDVYYAPLIRQAVAGLSPAEAAEGLLWASINVFCISTYTSIRWSTSHIKISKPTQFIRNHWLWNNTPRISNSSARLWWLVEMANRASEYSVHSSEILFHAMANNVGLYHQLSDRPYFAAKPNLVAAIYDVVLAGNEYVYPRPQANQLLRALNMKAGTMSFDILNYDELYAIVEESLPPKGRGATE